MPPAIDELSRPGMYSYFHQVQVKTLDDHRQADANKVLSCFSVLLRRQYYNQDELHSGGQNSSTCYSALV